jgi:formate-dependent nitrite reductase cytochrome c552 subunit
MMTETRLFSYIIAVAGSLCAVLLLARADRSAGLAPGPETPGHEDLDCASCHAEAPGTLRQQLQALSRYYLGLRADRVVLGHEPVSNSACVACHDTPNDLHPVYRFEEARFAAARAAVSAHQCGGCHVEHTGARVSKGGALCVTCHASTVFGEDQVTPTHAALIDEARWGTCLQCHDFHGNHGLTVPSDLGAAVPRRTIDEYLHGETDSEPYGPTTTPAVSSSSTSRGP